MHFSKYTFKAVYLIGSFLGGKNPHAHFNSAAAPRYAEILAKVLTTQNVTRQMSSHCVKHEGHDRWFQTTKRSHWDKISVVLITSVCNVIYP